MADHLAAAFADCDRSYHNACKAVASVGPMLTGGIQSLGLQTSKLAKAQEQYLHFRGWAFVAVKAIASKIAGQDVFVGRVLSAPRTSQKALELPTSFKWFGDRVDPLEAHPLLEALCSPNPLMTRWPLMFSTVASVLLTGRAYWWLAETEDGLQLWPIPSHWIEPADVLRGTWKLRPFGGIDTFELPGEDVCPFVYPDPSNPFGSVSPLQSQALAVATDEEIQQSQHRAFTNGIFPTLAFRVGRLPGMVAGEAGERPVLDPEQRTQLVEAVHRLYGGGNRQGNPLILDGMIEGVDKLTHGPAEMDFLDSGKQVKSRILQAFGVNPIIAGEVEDVNRASSAMAGQHFCENTVNPLCELISQSLTRWVGQRFASKGEKLVAWVDCCRSDDPELRLREWQVARTAGDVTTNEFRTHVLNLPAVDGGDVFRDQLGNPIEAAGKSRQTSRNGHARF